MSDYLELEGKRALVTGGTKGVGQAVVATLRDAGGDCDYGVYDAAFSPDGDKVLTRQVLGACGYLAQSSRVLHFGLGDRTGIDRVEITWPSGRRQTINSPTADTLHSITEPAR